MTTSKIIDGMNDAIAWTKATRDGTELPTEADRAFLKLLDTKQRYIILGEHPRSTLDRCRRYDWAGYDNGWLLTEAGRIVLETRVHAPDANEREEA